MTAALANVALNAVGGDYFESFEINAEVLQRDGARGIVWPTRSVTDLLGSSFCLVIATTEPPGTALRRFPCSGDSLNGCSREFQNLVHCPLVVLVRTVTGSDNHVASVEKEVGGQTGLIGSAHEWV